MVTVYPLNAYGAARIRIPSNSDYGENMTGEAFLRQLYYHRIGAQYCLISLSFGGSLWAVLGRVTRRMS